MLHPARVVADHLLTRRTPAEAGLRAWKTIGKRPWAGLSHGASGIALALHRLGARTGERALLDAATEAFSAEDSLFSEVNASGGHRDRKSVV